MRVDGRSGRELLAPCLQERVKLLHLLAQAPHDPDVKALLRLAAVWNIPVACNRATADFLISSPLMDEVYPRLVADFSDYTNRKV